MSCTLASPALCLAYYACLVQSALPQRCTKWGALSRDEGNREHNRLGPCPLAFPISGEADETIRHDMR